MSVDFPKECSGCKKKLDGDADYSEYYSVYQCRKEHWTVCCKVECQRLLDKRCGKVAEGLRKMQHKLNNDGHTSALRRLPPGEREKLKQYAEAENNNLLICPHEGKAQDRSVAYCAHVMIRKGGYGKQTSDKDDGADDATPSMRALDQDEGTSDDKTPFFPDVDIVDDDNLVELKRDDQLDGEDTPATKQKKGTKNKSQKKAKNVIQIDFRTPGMGTDEVYPETSTPTVSNASRPAAWFQNPSTRNINGTVVSQAWNAASNGRRMEAANADGGGTPASRPPDFAQRVSTLSSTTGCSESRAIELLEQNQYRLESAADAFFAQDSIETETKPRWGPRSQGIQAQVQQHSSQAHQSEQRSQDEEVSHRQPQEDQAQPEIQPAPSQPIPPRLPPEWQALWNEEQGAYYYWHVPTNHTTWDAPVLDDERAEESTAAAAADAERARQQAEEDGRNVMASRVSELTGLNNEAARDLLQLHGWDLDQAVRSHNQEVEARQARELEAQRQAEEAERAAEQARSRALEAERERQQQSEEGVAQPEPPEPLDPLDRYELPLHCLCNQHWWPRHAGTIGVLKGDRVMVSWMDPSRDGWVYGQSVDDKEKLGYFPRAVLRLVEHTPSQRSVGEVCGVNEVFEGPEDIGGYLDVYPGDSVKVLHPLDAPYVWAYCELLKSRECEIGEWGWIPEYVLKSPLSEDA